MTCLACCLLVALVGEPPAKNPEPTRVRVYTNADLDRIAPLRDQTGALSQTASDTAPLTSSAAPLERTGDSALRLKEEAYWRREAARVREKVAALQDQAAELRARLEALTEERRLSSRSPGRTGSDPATAIARRLARLDSRMRALEEDLADRARRARALPGWLR